MALIADQPAFIIDLSDDTTRRVFVIQKSGLSADEAVSIYQRFTGSSDPVSANFYNPDPATFEADLGAGLMLIQVG